VSVPRVPGVPGVPTLPSLRGTWSAVPGTRAAHGGMGESWEPPQHIPRQTTAEPGASVGQAVPPLTDSTEAGGEGKAGPAVVAVVLPLHLAPVGNRREHPMARARRTRREIAAVLGALTGHTPPALPAVFELTRTGWNSLDPDGLVAALKAPIDALASWVEVDDRDRRLFWRLAQSVTRERRRTRGRWGAASCLRIVVRPWQSTDGDDPLRVLAVAPPTTEAP
jgi:hypothetical protein